MILNIIPILFFWQYPYIIILQWVFSECRVSSKIRSTLLVYLQLTENLYTWLKTVSLFILPKKASPDIVCASNLDSPNQPEAKEIQSTLAPIPKKTCQYISILSLF